MDFPTFSVEGETAHVQARASQCPLNRTSFRSSSSSSFSRKMRIARKAKSINLWRVFTAYSLNTIEMFSFRSNECKIYIYIYISPSLFLLSSSSPTFAIPLFFFLLHRKDDASTCKSSATIRCLNINPSTEVGSFQFRSRDRSWNITSDLKLDSSQTFTTVFLPLLSLSSLSG